MIIKKPYTILVKYFRLINGFLFAMLLYITLKSYNIYNFFNDYAINRYFSSASDLSSTYINFITFITIILSLILSLIVFFILNMKKKDNKTYLFTFILMIVLFIYNIYMLSVFSSLETKLLDIKIVRIYRDISLMITAPQAILTIILFIRTLGFNIKQLELNKGLDEANAVEKDNEEIELTIEDNSYKYKRFFRKLLRLTKYEIVENKLFFVCLSSVIVLIVSLSLFVKVKVYNKEYNENQLVSANSLVYKVNESYITNYNLNNEIILNNKKYLIVNLNIKNNYITDFDLKRETFSLIIDNKSILPTFSLKNEFIDLGSSYEASILESNSNKDYILIFEIDKNNVDKSYVLKIKNNIGNTISEIESKYKYIKVTPTNLDNVNTINTSTLPVTIDLKDSILNNIKLSIDKYEISDKFKDNYSKLSNNSYKDIYYTIVPNNIGSQANTILKLTTSIETNGNSRINNIISSSSKLIDYYGIIKYKSLGKEKEINAKIIETEYNKNKYVYLDVPNDIKKADNIDLLLIIRGKKYIINLK